MLSFYQLSEKLPQYKFQPYDAGKKIANTLDGDSNLTPLEPEDMARYASDDVVDAYVKLHKGKNPARLGEPMSDEEYRKFMGIPLEDE